jgi:hypothetical protein
MPVAATADATRPVTTRGGIARIRRTFVSAGETRFHVIPGGENRSDDTRMSLSPRHTGVDLKRSLVRH